MKKLLIYVAVLSMVCAGAAQAQLGPITVDNHSFELPGTGKTWDWETVPSWSTDVVATHSGVDTNSYVGDWAGYMMVGSYPDYPVADPPVWQLTDHSVAAGELIKLTVDSAIGWMITDTSADLGKTSVLRMTLYYGDGGARTVAKEVDVTLSGVSKDYSVWGGLQGDFAEYTLELDVDNDCPAAIGSNLGIEFFPVSHEGPSGRWANVDNVRLDIVPEPATMVLLGLGSLALLKRRRA